MAWLEVEKITAHAVSIDIFMRPVFCDKAELSGANNHDIANYKHEKTYNTGHFDAAILISALPIKQTEYGPYPDDEPPRKLVTLSSRFFAPLFIRFLSAPDATLFFLPQ